MMPQVKTTIFSPPAAPPLPSFEQTSTNPCNLLSKEFLRNLSAQFCHENDEVRHIYALWTILNPDSSTSNCTCYYSHLRPILQAGPTCGLVALAMICSVTEASASLEEIFHKAQVAGYSKKGEMFSSYDMASLSQCVVSDLFCITHHSSGMHGLKDKIIACVRDGGFILVPYDADKNHSPAMLSGRKAHWAILCGTIHDSEKVFLIARQGKSIHPALWNFESLADSNANLTEIRKDLDSEEFIIHNIKSSLAGNFIQFERIQKINCRVGL